MSNEYSFNAGIVLILPLLHPKLISRYHLPATPNPQIFGLWVVAFMNLPLADIPLPLLLARPRT